MSRTFKVDQCPYDENEKVYAKNKITFEPGITILVGCNGSGKTTMIDCIIESQLKKLNIPVFNYSNLKSGGHNAISKSAFFNDFARTALLMQSSEGEQIFYNMGDTAAAVGRFAHKHKDAKELWFLFDAIDSGLSIDYIIDVKDQLFKTILEHNSDKDVYIIVSANNYEFCKGSMCMDVHNCKYVNIRTYEGFHKFVMKSRAIKDERYRHDKEENT